VAVFFLGCALVLNGSASYGDVTAFTAYTMQLLWPAVRFSELAQQLENVRISSERLFEALGESPTVVETPGARAIPSVRGDVEFQNVSFAYLPEKPVLAGFTLSVKAGQTIALVGPTGCGKTTLLALLMRLYDIENGAITIDGVPIREFTLHSLRRQFGIVLQESMLFTVSIADNVRYARPEASLEDVIAACKIAEIHDDILALPKGYNAVIGSRDVQLSTGQKQRLAIARAILASPAILIMDEATSALDTRSERAIQLAMSRFLQNRTAFIVAHRLATIRNADQIVLIDKGSIVELGDHDTLMAVPNGRYRNLFETYSGRGIIEEGEHT
jgi:ATP-binding cassette subfamily B protein